MIRKLISSVFLALILFAQFYNTVVWIRYELNVEEITEMFCVNKDKPELMCNGKCYVAKELIDIDIFPQAPTTSPTEANYLPSLKSFLPNKDFAFAPHVTAVLVSAAFDSRDKFWDTVVLEPPFTPPQI